MKIVAISDIHGFLFDGIPDCDLLLIAGDFSPPPYFPIDRVIGMHAMWCGLPFSDWLDKINDRGITIVSCAGNHDIVMERKDLLSKLNWTYLEDSGVEFRGMKIWGSPWSLPPFPTWPYEWTFRCQTEEELAAKFAKIPDDIDILITHAPPQYLFDRVKTGEHVGSYALAMARQRLKSLKLHCFGHIHEGRGGHQLGDLITANVSSVDERMVLRPNPFVEFEI